MEFYDLKDFCSWVTRKENIRGNLTSTVVNFSCPSNLALGEMTTREALGDKEPTSPRSDFLNSSRSFSKSFLQKKLTEWSNQICIEELTVKILIIHFSQYNRDSLDGYQSLIHLIILQAYIMNESDDQNGTKAGVILKYRRGPQFPLLGERQI